jgi:magnesium transporter
MITIFKRGVKQESFSTLKKPEVGSWIRVQKPTLAILDNLIKMIPGLDKDILQDTVDIHEMPRIEKEGDFIYILVRAPIIKDNQLLTAPFLLVVSSKYFISFEPTELNFLDHLMSPYEDIYTTQRSKLLIYSLIYLSREYAYHTEDLYKSTQQKKILLKKLKSADLVHLIEAEEILNSFITSLMPTINVMERILSGKSITFHKNDQDLIQDLIIEYRQTLSLAQTTVKSTQNIRSAYSTIIDYNQNMVIKFLTSFTIILTIPTIVASIYGMNVGLPFQGQPYAFWIVILFTFFLSAIAYIIFHLMDWL